MLFGRLCALAIALAACGGGAAGAGVQADTKPEKRKVVSRGRAIPVAGTTQGSTESERRRLCDAQGAAMEASEYDTSGDDVPDVRKVFKRLGTPPLTRLVLVCRESDLNADGVKDVLRFYDDEGRPLREESDRNFDGKMDQITVCQEGQVVRKEIDGDGNGVIDTKVFYDDGEALRGERDLKGRSTARTWRPDRWEYYEEGRTIRMGTDLDGDGKVDRWDRDDTLRSAKKRQEELQQDEPREARGEGEGTEGSEASQTAAGKAEG
ncbi:MAG: hypothetical protein MJD61_06080 [Proteobacteria bacterium]|nr:hypothetical protein [Pseudomonadota bacterium]